MRDEAQSKPKATTTWRAFGFRVRDRVRVIEPTATKLARVADGLSLSLARPPVNLSLSLSLSL